VFRERKRNVQELDDIRAPERKKPRIEGAVGEDEMPGVEEAPSATEPVHSPPSATAQRDKRKEEGNLKMKVKDSGSAFKENPYTFLAPDDPILLSCMLVSFLIYMS
jgi:hypothetical protein